MNDQLGNSITKIFKYPASDLVFYVMGGVLGIIFSGILWYVNGLWPSILMFLFSCYALWVCYCLSKWKVEMTPDAIVQKKRRKEIRIKYTGVEAVKMVIPPIFRYGNQKYLRVSSNSKKIDFIYPVSIHHKDEIVAVLLARGVSENRINLDKTKIAF